jgi:UDP-GlcNAc:undecaprenyl-phosphate/decaprenyl-phosphate GlcNAc-1-phosphate transferase
MIGLGAFVTGALVSALLWRLLGAQLTSSPVLRRVNYRGQELPMAGGVVIVLTSIMIGAIATVIVAVGGTTFTEAQRLAALTAGATLGFGFVGLLDDLVGAAITKGFRGHLGALAHGEVTTGLVKLVWGVFVGVLAAGTVRGGLLIAATANLGNLFDRAPGRAIKVSLIGAGVVLAAGVPAWAVSAPLLVVGAGAGVLFADLRERCMLGDTGSNVLGAAVGFGLVVALGATGEWIGLTLVLAANALSELVSFSKLIDAVAPLRWVDRLGATPQRRAHPRQ